MTFSKQPKDETYSNTIPYGSLGIIAMPGCEELAEKVDAYIAMWRAARTNDIEGYHKDSYIIDVACPRFGSGEAKGMLKQSIRGDDLYIMADVTNYTVTYKMFGREVPLSPDDHFQNIKRIIAAANGKAKRITVIMPFLYESRQHRRNARESLDCAIALQELVNIGVSSIVTLDAHDPRVQNAIPYTTFESVNPVYQNIKALLKNEKDLIIDPDHLMIISPDEGAMGRAIEYSTALGVNMGMFYKRRDFTRVVDGKNPIVAHEYLGESVEGKDVIIIDDMISSGDSILDVARQLKARKARKIFTFATFGLFTRGMDVFDKAVEEGIIDRVYTSNCIYQSPETKSRKYYRSVDVSKYIALLIDNMNHDVSIEKLIWPYDKIRDRVTKYKALRAQETE
ncbi:MAG: ribose-phosphate pyrophosphokinase [Lachnospiraceae bacterium]|nr:ribose-phosphate pyrophosphokinase [Lachnospiraceae bacterium]